MSCIVAFIGISEVARVTKILARVLDLLLLAEVLCRLEVRLEAPLLNI